METRHKVVGEEARDGGKGIGHGLKSSVVEGRQGGLGKQTPTQNLVKRTGNRREGEIWEHPAAMRNLLRQKDSPAVAKAGSLTPA